MAHRERNVPSEASIPCPKCGKSYKVRTLKKHVKEVHELLCIYTCVFPTGDGEVCNFACGKRISCMNNHQSRRHGVKFDALSEHKYNEDNFFILRLIPLQDDEHTADCDVETNYFQVETMKEVRRKIKEKAAAIRKVLGDGLAAGVRKGSKRKSGLVTPEKVAKRRKKETMVKGSQEKEALPAAESIPFLEDDITGKSGEPNKENAVGVVIAAGGTQNDEGPKDGEVPDNEPEENESEESMWEHFNAHQDISDSEDDDDEVVCLTPKPQVKLDEALIFTPGCGRFSPDVTQICNSVRTEMQEAYPALANDPKGWKSVIRKLQKAWHPNHNMTYFAKCNEVFKVIDQERLKLEG
jgi:hypothetical protein